MISGKPVKSSMAQTSRPASRSAWRGAAGRDQLDAQLGEPAGEVDDRRACRRPTAGRGGRGRRPGSTRARWLGGSEMPASINGGPAGKASDERIDRRSRAGHSSARPTSMDDRDGRRARGAASTSREGRPRGPRSSSATGTQSRRPGRRRGPASATHEERDEPAPRTRRVADAALAREQAHGLGQQPVLERPQQVVDAVAVDRPPATSIAAWSRIGPVSTPSSTRWTVTPVTFTP